MTTPPLKAVESRVTYSSYRRPGGYTNILRGFSCTQVKLSELGKKKEGNVIVILRTAGPPDDVRGCRRRNLSALTKKYRGDYVPHIQPSSDSD